MKKILFIITISLFCTALAINTYAKDQLKLFYNDELINLSQEVITQGDEYFLNAKELTAVIGTDCKIDISNRNLTIEIANTTAQYNIESYDYSIIDSLNISHNTPELINRTVYLPFSLISELYNVDVKYDKNANRIYFFPKDRKIDTFVNDKYNYNITIPEHLYIELDEIYDSFDASSVSITNEDKTFSASIICDTVNKSAIKNMRFLLSDYVSPENYIFDRIVEYKQSYFRSLINSYKNEFLFGNLNKNLSESNIKIIRDYSEDIFGIDSNIILFNTISSNKFTSVEDTNLIITIPSYKNRIIYSLNFSIPKGELNDHNIDNIKQVISNLTIKNLSNQKKSPNILHDRTSVETANRGIYPNIISSEKEYTSLEDTDNFYSIKYPSHYIPYLQNNFIDNYGYRSFKISHNSSFSITTEHLAGKSDRITNKIDSLKSYYNTRINISSIENQNINGKDFTILHYELDNTYTKEFVTNYYIINGLRVYTIQLKSLMSKPTDNTLDEFKKIISSFEFIEQQIKNDIHKTTSFVKFSDEHSGYSIFYPDNWSIQDSSQDINYDFIEITNPNFSGPLDIFINESEYSAKLTNTELLRYTTGYDSSLSKYIKNYVTPYTNKTYKILDSSITTYGDAIVINKLVNYIDEGDRYKMCYCIDLIRNNKINSLFISASEYLFQNGVLKSKDLNYILEYMTESFKTEESDNIYVEKEKRNEKILFIENFFKKALGESTKVTFAKNLSSEKDVLVYINNTDKSGAYRLNFDYNSRKIQVKSRVLSSDIVKYAKEKMINILKGKYLHDISVDSDNMTITVKYSYTPDTLPIVKEYNILVTPSRDEYAIDFIIKLNSENVEEKCENFLENHFLTDVQISFPKNYSYTNENINKYYYEKRIIPIYAESDGQSGYFYLEIDPMKDSIEILKHISIIDLKERIEEYYYLIDPTSKIVKLETTDSDNFSFSVSVISKTNELKKETIYMYYDKDVVFLSKDPYFSGILLSR